ncbi:HAD-IA family hydrolase [Rhodovastum atsumiense]|uniref:HAD-IA family hydrolase n=1 Tax=Rhodovastum atsumiense TaxID=504468 RepID=A0A5M6IXW5_9PROT|nr:HAD-IA family hydrolase [Rhodovastum atsumiense]KAA5612205.1 HAD-IA family hydrolase [Rhodovastum atsumiense]CAH2603838.1 HAD-IA family hydrolase [Rhodovastum atsumiense]
MKPATLDHWAAARMGVAAPLTEAAVAAYQLAHLRETLAHARAASPFYRCQDWPTGLPDSLADLARWPFTTPADLQRGDPALLAISQREVARVVTLETSGTSGPPKRVHFTAADLEATVDFFHHGMALFTRPGDRVVIAFPAARPGGVGDALAQAARRLGAEPVPAPLDQPVETMVALLRAERPQVVFGPPVRLLAAARVSACDGGPSLSVRAALASSDSIPAALGDVLRRHWRCELFAHWGMTETGYGGALECGCHAGQHLRETDLYVEVVDPLTGAVLPQGARGELVLTTLRRRGVPLIRYRTGDLGRLLPGRCACGSVLRRLDERTGRTGGHIALPGGAALSLSALDAALFALDRVTDFTAELHRTVPPRLAVCVASPAPLRGPGVTEAVRRVLATTPAIRSVLESGALGLEVTVAEATTCRHGGKRRLVCRPGPVAQWPRAVLFDLDGTLLDSVPDVHRALTVALARAGLPPLPLPVLRPLVGGGARRLIERACAVLGHLPDTAGLDALVTAFLAAYHPCKPVLTTPRAGVHKVTRRLVDAGLQLAVVTNRPGAEATTLLERFGLSDVIEVVVGGDAGPPKKPDPGLVLLACAWLGVPAAEAVMVGDSAYDVDAARAANMASVVMRGGCSAQPVETLGAARVIDGPDDLPEALRGLGVT